MAQYGLVNGDATEATVALTVQGGNGKSEDIIFVVDTGDTGDLSLPHDIIARLNLPKIAEEEPLVVTLADGTTRQLNVYYAHVAWHGRLHEVEVVELGVDPLVGMGLLRGSNLSADTVPGGLVTITELPNPS